MRKILLTAFICIFFTPNVFALTIGFSPTVTNVEVGNIFSVDILADIPETEPIIGWGLDLIYDDLALSLIGSPIIGPNWTPLLTPDGDGFAGSFLPPFPPPFPPVMGVTGSNILLAQISYSVLQNGEFNLTANYTQGDFTEGFALPGIGSFATPIFEGATIVAQQPENVTPVPEPSTIFMLGISMIGLFIAKRKELKA